MSKYTVLNFCEFDEKAVKIYNALHNMTSDKNIGDITQASENNIHQCDILFSSSPCQSFSNIGLREGGEIDSNTKSSLMWHNLRFVKAANPKIVIWENVASASTGKNKKNFDAYCEAMVSLGYKNVWKILNPKDFGVPQNRKRLFFVSIRNDLDSSKFAMPQESNEPIDMFDYLDRNVDKKYIVPRQVMNGYSNKQSIFKKRWLIKKPGDCAYCLTAKSGRAVITNNYIFNDWDMYNNPPCELSDIDYMAQNDVPVRALTPLEYWRLQSIPEYYYNRAVEIGTTDAQLYIRAGNGINVHVCYLVFKALYEAYPNLFDDMKYITLFTGIGMPEMALNELYKEINHVP